MLTEFVDSRGAEVQIDRKASVLQGVKLLGLRSRNGRRYREAALTRAIPLYEGAKVNVNHPSGDPLSPRDYRDRLGVIRGVRHRPGEGLFGSLYFNPKHALAEQLAWDAEYAPENVGFSHNVLAKTTREAGGLTVEAIEKVQSVDLVADPATTKGLFEQAEPSDPQPTPVADAWDRLTLRELELHRPDLLAELAEQHQAELLAQREQIDELIKKEALTHRRRRIDELLKEHGLPGAGDPDPTSSRITSHAFYEALIAAPDDTSVRRLIADRADAIQEAVHRETPVEAREQDPVAPAMQGAPNDVATFVSAVTSR
ncbi:MAG: hypothetical protein AAGB00_13230 [Planctomycetota bacterium]